MSPDTSSVVLRDSRDAQGWRSLIARVDAEGNLVLTGSDGGPGVSTVLGADITEYEWVELVLAADLPTALALAGGGRPSRALTVMRRLVWQESVDTWLKDVRAAGLLHLRWNRHSS